MNSLAIREIRSMGILIAIELKTKSTQVVRELQVWERVVQYCLRPYNRKNRAIP